MNIIVESETELQCYICGKPFRVHDNLARHILIHVGVRKKLFKLKKNKFITSFLKYLVKYHQIRHLKSKLNPLGRHLIVLCRKKINDASILRRHFRSSMKKCNKISTNIFENAHNQPLIKCNICPKVCGTALSQKLHTMSHKTWKCVPCGRKVTSAFLLKLHHKSHQKGLFCRNKSRGKKVKLPVLSHEENIRNTCSTCKKKFSSKSCLNRHQRVHTGEKPYKCDECGELFRERIVLNKHMVKHTGIPMPKKHQCVSCGKAFTLSSILQHHMRGHGEKHFACTHCDKRFSHKKLLERHVKTHVNEKQFSCELCSKKFLTKSNMLRHARTHTEDKPFKCDTCAKSFRQAGNLKMHERVHTKEKPYECKDCGRRFTQCANLKHHTLIHTAKKLHKCVWCSKTFIDLCDLRNHEINTHNNPRLSAVMEIRKSSQTGESASKSPNHHHHEYDGSSNMSRYILKDYSCKGCHRAFTDARDYIRHVCSQDDSRVDVINTEIPHQEHETTQGTEKCIKSNDCSTSTVDGVSFFSNTDTLEPETNLHLVAEFAYKQQSYPLQSSHNPIIAQQRHQNLTTSTFFPTIRNLPQGFSAEPTTSILPPSLPSSNIGYLVPIQNSLPQSCILPAPQFNTCAGCSRVYADPHKCTEHSKTCNTYRDFRIDSMMSSEP